MRIGLLAPSIYMSPTRFGEMIFAPRELSQRLADGLVAAGHDVFFFTAPDVPTRATIVQGDMRLMEDLVETKLAAAGGERQKWASFYTRKRNYELDLTERAYAMAREGKLDIIHSYHDTLAHFFDELTGFPTVYTLHDPLPRPGTLPHWLLSKFSHHRYVSISDAQRRSETLRLNFVPTVYHGVPVPAVSEAPEEGDSYLAFMGRMAPEKGVEDAIEAAQRAGMNLRIATSETVSTSQGEHVTQVGFMGAGEKNAFLAGARALLFPIHWEEPFGMVMIEAMACGTPVIAYNRGSVPEIVKDGVTGFIVSPDVGDLGNVGNLRVKKRGVEGLVEAVQRIGEIDRAACRRHVEENFTVEKMITGYERVYQSILALKACLPARQG